MDGDLREKMGGVIARVANLEDDADELKESLGKLSATVSDFRKTIEGLRQVMTLFAIVSVSSNPTVMGVILKLLGL